MPLSPEALTLAPILVIVILLWITEALPLAVTALLGAVACVVAGVAPAKEVFRPFADPLIFLFIGSFLLAEAIRIHGLDRRLAYGVLSWPWIAERPARIIVAVAFVSVVISSFVSNTATTAMMMTIASGILAAVEAAAVGGRGPRPAFATSLFLCVAFSASIGGLATPIGTPPNLIGLAFIRDQVGVTVSFLGWCAIGIPIVVIMTAFAVAVLVWLFPAGVARIEGVDRHVAAERSRLGPWTVGQRSAAGAFAVTIALWVIPGVLLVLLGASHPLCLWLARRLPEGVAALIGAILLFVLPGDATAAGGRRRALEWRQAQIDWDIVLLYGGGMALGELCFSTGLAAAIGQSITGWIPAGDRSGPVLVVVATIVAVVTSEFTSNTASANMVVPVVIALARATGADPLPAALAATFASSLGFMMPVSTPCNAIVYGSGRVPLRSMMAGGAIIDVAGIVTVTAALLLTSWL